VNGDVPGMGSEWFALAGGGQWVDGDVITDAGCRYIDWLSPFLRDWYAGRKRIWNTPRKSAYSLEYKGGTTGVCR
jgi:hypothetical protein